eukprot:5506416-Ditylum_brightwellii.AAC.1
MNQDYIDLIKAKFKALEDVPLNGQNKDIKQTTSNDDKDKLDNEMATMVTHQDRSPLVPPAVCRSRR